MLIQVLRNQYFLQSKYLQQAYDFYKSLFWDGFGGRHFYYAYDSVICLNKMVGIGGGGDVMR